MSDVLIDLEITLHVQIYQHRHLGFRLPATEGSAHPFSASHQLEGPCRDFLASSSNTDDNRGTPTSGRALQSLSHHLHVACAIEGEIYTKASFLDDVRLHGSSLRQLLRIDSVCGAPLPSHFQLVFQQVNSDDLGAASLGQGLEHREADGAETKDGGSGAPLHLSRVPHCTPASGDPATQETALLQGSILADFGQRLGVKNAVFSERACAHEVVDGLALVGEPWLSIPGHDALASVGADRGAQIDVRSLAKLAAATVGLIARNDVIPRLEALDSLANALHDAAGLVSQDTREQALRIQTPQSVSVSVAQRHSSVLDSHLTLLRRPDGDLHQGKRLLGLERHSSQALDVLPNSGGRSDRAGVDRGRRKTVRAPSEDASEEGCMVLEVVLDECGDEEVAVIIAFTHPQGQGQALLVASLLQSLRAQLVLTFLLLLLAIEVVRCALIHQKSQGRPAVPLDELDGVILFPGFL
mmetsp:Transcript_22987/g.34289  ORF Transcript_22987/g.34289 Transcript_22987/m.34289 type:complete len:469 (+) Transcript_22987:788-2194(+)